MKMHTTMRSQERIGARRQWGTVLLVVAGLAAVLLLAAAVRWQDGGDSAATPMAAPISATTTAAPGFSSAGGFAGTGIAGENVQGSSPARFECEDVAYPTTC